MNTINFPSNPLTPIDYSIAPWIDQNGKPWMWNTTHSIWESATLVQELIGIACSDETTVLTTGEKVVFDLPISIVITRVYATLNIAPTISALTLSVKDEGTSILNAALSIGVGNNNAETLSFVSAASSYSMTKGDKLSVNIESVGSSNAGLKVFLEGHRS